MQFSRTRTPLLSIAALGLSLLACDPQVDPPIDTEPLPDAGAGPDAPGAADPTLGGWAPGFTLPGLSGFAARVDDLARGPDGRLYAGGIFDDAAGVAVHNVAVWDGTGWAPLGAGLDGRVTRLMFDADGVLWAALTRDDGATGALARWDAAAGVWSFPGAELDGGVEDLAVTDDGIVIVGTFTMVGEVAARGVARYQGSTWHAVGDGTLDGYLTAVAAYGAEICVAGNFAAIGGAAADNAACWDGAAWAPLGSGLAAGIDVLTRSPGGIWYAGGTTTYIVDPETGAFEAGLATLRGPTWVPFAGGIHSGAVNRVRDIQFAGDAIVVAGHFNAAGRLEPTLTRGIAMWSPDAGWSEVAGGLANEVGVHGPAETLGYAIELDGGGGLWIGGLFSRAGGVPAASVAYAPSLRATPVALVDDQPDLGVGGFVDALALDGARLLVGGLFPAAGGQPIDNLGALDGAGWSAPSAPAPGIVRDVVVRPDGTIAIAGQLVIESRPVAFALWDGEAWTTTGGPVPGDGYDLFVDDDGSLWLAGDLGLEVGAAGQHVRRLDAAGWTAVGAWGGGVSRLIRHDGQLIAAGFFRSVDGEPAAGIAVREGERWVAHPGGGVEPTGRVSTLASSPALGLVVGGYFESVGGVPAAAIARWDGASWRPLGGGVRSFFGRGFVTAMATHGDGLFVSGSIAYAGDTPVSHLAWFADDAWHGLGVGLQDFAEELVVADDRLWIGGGFTVAGGVPSAGLAIWDFATPQD